MILDFWGVSRAQVLSPRRQRRNGSSSCWLAELSETTKTFLLPSLCGRGFSLSVSVSQPSRLHSLSLGGWMNGRYGYRGSPHTPLSCFLLEVCLSVGRFLDSCACVSVHAKTFPTELIYTSTHIILTLYDDDDLTSSVGAEAKKKSGGGAGGGGGGGVGANVRVSDS